ncbi:VOC family protein [Paracandidimonas soli]|uniref:VOC family protein n=1 Tax=Paracandidimonas soli TaxID=1917182 RepID=UPI00333E889B
MNANPAPTCTAFDHLVVMLRDEIDARTPGFEAAGYRLGARGVHNLGSINRLIVLDSSYIELLGWPAGEPPRRKEIADQPLGLDALVFRSENAARDQQRLRDAGFDADPVSHLERPIDFHGQTQTVRFDTVRFATQPIAGLRVYFCQHLTPQYVWEEALQQHPNGARSLHRITIAAADAEQVAQTLAVLTGGAVSVQDKGYSVALSNAELVVQFDSNVAGARIVGAQLLHDDGVVREFGSGLL